MKRVTTATVMLFNQIIAQFVFADEVSDEATIREYVNQRIEEMSDAIETLVNEHPIMMIIAEMTSETVVGKKGLGKRLPIEIALHETEIVDRFTIGVKPDPKPFNPKHN